MKVTEIRSDKIYTKILNAKPDKKDNIYRYDLMNKFSHKWACYNVPIKAKQKGGYDAVMTSSMLGYMAPSEIDESKLQIIERISKDDICKLCTESIEKAISLFIDAGVQLNVEEYKYTILLPNPESIYTKLSESCCGDGEFLGVFFYHCFQQNLQSKKSHLF